MQIIKKMNKQYLITADDYGFCPEVDSAIEELAKKGILSTTNVLVNFRQDFTGSPLIGKRDFSIGIHWNVTTGRPVSPLDKVKTLVDENGVFWPIDEFRRRYKKGLISESELEAELQNQFDIYYKNFGQPDYWNSHENSSLYPAPFKVFKKVALKKGIRATRNFQRVYVDYDNCRGFKRKLRELLVSSYVNFKYGIIEKRNFHMPDGRIVTFVNHTKTDFERMKTCLEKTQKKSVEIIIHPAVSGDNPLFGNITTDRVDEYKAFMSDRFYALFTENGNKIVTYKDI
jgi:predicted glycoside hydrolase/deacetylase ChbG (UPF0249 family)